MEPVLDEIIKGNYIKESRPIFEAYTDSDNKEIFLNEVVIHSGSVTKMLDLELSLKKQVIYNLKADGLIISFNFSILLRGKSVKKPTVPEFIPKKGRFNE